MSYFRAKMHNSILAGVPPQTPLGGAYTPRPLAGFKGSILPRGRRGREEKGLWEGKGRGMEGRGGRHSLS